MKWLLLASSILLFAPNFAAASDWTSLSQIAGEDYFGDSKPKLSNKVFYKIPFEKTGDIVRVVVLIDNNFGGFSNKEFSNIDTTDYDCKKKLVKSISDVSYTGHMGTGAVFQTTNYTSDFHPVETSYSQKEYAIACSNPKIK